MARTARAPQTSSNGADGASVERKPVFASFWPFLEFFKRFSGEAKIINLVATDFFLFGPGRARREQPNAGLHLGVRAFVRSVSHVKVLVTSLFGLLGILRSTLDGASAADVPEVADAAD